MFSTDPSRLLFFARKKSLRRMSLDTPDPADVVVPVAGIQHAVAIDFDPVDKFIYWSDIEAFEIKRAKTDGTGIYWMWMSNFDALLHATWLLVQFSILFSTNVSL